MPQFQQPSPTPELFQALAKNYMDWRRQNMESLSPESVGMGLAGGPFGMMGILTKAIAPSQSVLMKVLPILRAAGITGVTKDTPKLGSIFERALMEVSPEAMMAKARIPGWGNLATGKIERGLLGGFHPTESIQPRMFRINEFPDYLSFEGFQGMTSSDVPKMIELMQSLGKPIVVPEAKHFGKYAGSLF